MSKFDVRDIDLGGMSEYERALWEEPFPTDDDGWARSTDDSDAVWTWIAENKDADLFPMIVAECMDEDEDGEEWTMERVENALRHLVRLGLLSFNGIFSAGPFFIVNDKTVADEDTQTEMLAITACRGGEPFDGASVTQVETGMVIGHLRTRQEPEPDPELAAWEREDVQERIRSTREDVGEDMVSDGPVEFAYDVYFAYPNVQRVMAFSVTEAVRKAIAQLSEHFAVYDPQVEGVSVVPHGNADEVRVGVVKDGRVIDSYRWR